MNEFYKRHEFKIEMARAYLGIGFIWGIYLTKGIL